MSDSPSQIVYTHLSNLLEPNDLHKLSDKELLEVAAEVRQAILDNVSKTGGHFSSNLGTVELAVAMYAVYSMPPDKVIWDTGHQAYPHKILTGRLPRFGTLRKYKGISGFLKRSEHELDYFGAGHAGTAISAALGFATARDRLGTKEKVIAITGDASICSGMSWEALNHAGELATDLTVVLNDNRMSIAPNVGALTSYFTRLRSRPFVQGAAERAKEIIEKLPDPMTRVAAGLRHGLTHYFAPEDTGTIFEEMGFEYIGPVDGHDLPTLLEIFRNIRHLDKPLFVHAITVKGKGYEVAEADATKWHGVVPFDPAACEMPSSSSGPVAYTKVFGSAIVEVAEEDDKVVAITAAMPDGTGLIPFAKKFPERYYDVGIAEQHAVTFAAGQAAGGLKPFCAIYSTFLQRGYDQVVHDVCIQNLPVRFVLDRGGLVGADGATHHGSLDISYLTSLPNMSVCAPRDGTELREMIEFMAGYNSGPIAMRYPRGSTVDNLPESRKSIEIGKAENLGSPGNKSGNPDLVMFALGSMVTTAWDVAKVLEEEGSHVVVINARFAKPIDIDTLVEALGPDSRLMTLEENVRIGGMGQQVRDMLAEAGRSDVEMSVVALPDRFVDHGSQGELLKELGMDCDGIIEAGRALLEKRRSPRKN